MKETIYRMTTSTSAKVIMASLTLIGLGLVIDFGLTQFVPDPQSSPPLITPDLPQIPLAR
jgi:hypothetical protein